MGLMVFLICLCISLLPCRTMAASTANAAGFISTEQECSLTISYGSAGIPVMLYQVADVSEDFHYTLTEPFASSGLTVNGVQSNAEWNIIRSTLEAYILANQARPITTVTTDHTGQAQFTSLKPGLYLAAPVQDPQDRHQRIFDSALVALPGLDDSGTLQYQVNVTAKPEITPPDNPGSDKEIQLKVLKLWRSDSDSENRPRQITVEIFRNGTSYQTVTLSSENNWTYTWTARDDGADWMVVERSIPSGYAMTMEKRGTSFILTNTRMPDAPNPTPPSAPPKTGDTSNILLYVIMLYVSGAVLVLLGISGKRKRT